MDNTDIKTSIELYRDCSPKNNRVFHGFDNLFDFVLKNGQTFEWAPLPKSIKPMKQGFCFQNAVELVLARPDLIYVEGYAFVKNTIPMPILHAWCVTDEGIVIDPTWCELGEGEYYGIPLNRNYVLKSILKAKFYGVIDNWRGKFPLLKDDKATWLHSVKETEHAQTC